MGFCWELAIECDYNNYIGAKGSLGVRICMPGSVVPLLTYWVLNFYVETKSTCKFVQVFVQIDPRDGSRRYWGSLLVIDIQGVCLLHLHTPWWINIAVLLWYQYHSKSHMQSLSGKGRQVNMSSSEPVQPISSDKISLASV